MILPHFDGAIGLLCDEWRWEKFGELTVEEAAALGCELWHDYVGGGSVLIGTIQAYAGALPDGVLPCDGALYDRAAYPELYDRLAPVYRVGPGAFRTPDLRDRYIRGGIPIGETGGADTHVLTEGEMPTHTHTIQNGYGPAVIPADWLGAALLAPAPTPEITSATGGGQPHENQPPYMKIRWGIIAK